MANLSNIMSFIVSAFFHQEPFMSQYLPCIQLGDVSVCDSVRMFRRVMSLAVVILAPYQRSEYDTCKHVSLHSDGFMNVRLFAHRFVIWFQHISHNDIKIDDQPTSLHSLRR